MKSRVLRVALGAILLTLLAMGQPAPPSQTKTQVPPAGQKTPPGQPPATPPKGGDQQQPPQIFTGGVTVVSMALSVTDKKGRFVTGLSKEEFEVLENGKPQTISEFTAEPTLPLRVAVLIDTSNSIRGRFRFEQEAASQFLQGMLRTTSDKAMVVSFDSTAEIASPLTENVDKLSNALLDLRPGGGTAMYDAIHFASKALGEEQPSYQFRRIIVVLSDGEDNQSRSTRDQALEGAQIADTLIFAISTNNLGAGDTDGDKILKYFTSQTGGRAYFPFKVEDLAQSFETIAEEVRHQYNIVYRPDPLVNDGLFHKVDIKVKGHKELTVRARAGYYASK